MSKHKYWIHAGAMILAKPGGAPIEEFPVCCGIALDQPITEFEHVGQVATFIANNVARERELLPGTAVVNVIGWTKFEAGSGIVVPNRIVQ